MIDNEVSRVFDRRSALFLGAATILTSALILRMLQMQVFSYKSYKRKSENNSFRVQTNTAKRGKILDNSNTIISKDIPIYRIYIIPEETDNLDGLIKILTNELNLKKKKVDWIYKKIKKQMKFQPILISENSDWNKLAELQAQNLDGLHIKSGFARSYELGSAGSQIFGYVGMPEKPVPNAPFFTGGITGLEKSFDNVLSGVPGQTVMIANAVGRITGEDKTQSIIPMSGNDLKTTIHSNVQKKLYDSLLENKSGCGVVLDIKTGNIIAMASVPSFYPNKFSTDDGEEYIDNLRSNFAKPFMNKALEGLYPPGSTFKIVVALAALESGALSPTEKIYCPGHWDYGDRRYHCWEEKGHGSVDLTEALKHSCDVYFYQTSLRIGIDAIKDMAVRLGLGEKFMNGILPREMAGVIPDRKWKEKIIGSRWMHGDTIISGIGQGFILSNCLQMAIMMGRVASNKNISPKLIKDDREINFSDLNLQQKNINAVLSGLEKVLQAGGTASGSAINVFGKKMGGKTGTSQVRSISLAERETGVLTNDELQWNGRHRGLFVGYAPTDNPKYAICTITEHSGSSSPAAHAAASVIREILKNG
jgi:penicillin-binding protein 2